MTQYTLSTGDGRTITDDRPEELVTAAYLWLKPERPSWTQRLITCLGINLEAGDIERAGNNAAALGLNFAASASPALSYFVPTDPADETNCDACQ